MIKNALFLMLLFFGAMHFYACSSAEKQNNATQSSHEHDASGSVKEEVKPMAMAMRATYQQAKALQQLLIANSGSDFSKFTYVEFAHLEPTDSSVLEENFFLRESEFKKHFDSFKISKENKTEAFNLMVESCVSCHLDYCGGPLKKIRKLFIK